jgi:hypothetical protein
MHYNRITQVSNAINVRIQTPYQITIESNTSKNPTTHILVYLSLIPNLNVLGSSRGGVVHGELSYRSSLKV